MQRREAVQVLSAVPLVAAFSWTPRDVQTAMAKMAAPRQGAFAPAFFTEHEYATVGVLVDLILPRDDRSGSATEAGVPEFMDHVVSGSENMQTPMRGGLAWLDRESRSRHGASFLESTDAQRRTILDDIAYPRRARPAFAAAVRWFNSFRDLTAGAFYSSKMGIEDLQYMGNTVVLEWTGCPPEQLNKLGVRYED